MRRTYGVPALILIGTFLLLGVLHRSYASFLPYFSDAVIRFDGAKPPVAVHMPIWYTVVPLPPIADITFTMELPHSFPRFFFVPHTGVLAALSVDGHALVPQRVPEMQDLATLLHAGSNRLRARIFSSDAFSGLILSLVPSLRNGVTFVHELLQLLIVLGGSFLFYRTLGIRLSKEIFWILLIGIVVRCLYVSGTPWYFRGYDSQGHLDYIWYVLQTHDLPFHSKLWQGHQAPLYYVLAALVAGLGVLSGSSKEAVILILQSSSLLLSIATLLIGTSVVFAFFKGRMQRALGVSLLATAPPLVFLSSQVSNDALLNVLGFLWCAALLRSVASPHSRSWFTAALAVSLAILTKANAVLWMLPTVVAFLLLTKISVRERLKRCMVLALLSPLWGWFYVWRFLADRGYGLVENARLLSSSVRVDLTLGNLFVFNPFALLLQPFVHHVAGPFRPEYFFESLLRSAQFGTSVYESFGRYPLLFAFVLIPVFFIGATSLIRRRESLPVFIILVLLIGLIVFCFRYPFTSSQHFRYIAVATLPIILCLVEGCSVVPGKIVRIFSEVSVFVYAILSALFVVGVFLSMW